MDELVVAVFDDEKQASDATRALDELHREGSITLYGDAVIANDASGQVVEDAYFRQQIATCQAEVATLDVSGPSWGAVFGKFLRQGEICMIANRIIVDDAFVERFGERVTNQLPTARARRSSVRSRRSPGRTATRTRWPS